MRSKSKHPELTLLAYAAYEAILRLEAEKQARQQSAENAEPSLAATSQPAPERTSPC